MMTKPPLPLKLLPSALGPSEQFFAHPLWEGTECDGGVRVVGVVVVATIPPSHDDDDLDTAVMAAI